MPASFNASLATLSEPNWADGELNWALYEPYWSPGASGATLASGPALSGALYFQAEILLEAMAPPANLRGRSKREWQQMRATACLAAEALEPVSDPPLPIGVTIDLSSLARPHPAGSLPERPCIHPRCRRMAHRSSTFQGKRYCCGDCPHNAMNLNTESLDHGPSCEGRLLPLYCGAGFRRRRILASHCIPGCAECSVQLA